MAVRDKYFKEKKKLPKEQKVSSKWFFFSFFILVLTFVIIVFVTLIETLKNIFVKFNHKKRIKVHYKILQVIYHKQSV